jgi:hypothetical protein
MENSEQKEKTLFMRSLNITRAVGALAVTAGMVLAGSARADFTLGYNIEFSGGQAPGGPAPWLTATFADTAPGQVTLTLSGAGLTGTENVSGWYFNVADAFIGTLSFAESGSPAPTSIQQQSNNFKADGDGLYDILFSFGTGMSGFGPGNSITEVITSTVGGLTANAFDELSAPGGGHGPFLSAAHVQNTTGAGSGGSGWIAPVPEPTTMIAGALLLLPFGASTLRILRKGRTI